MKYTLKYVAAILTAGVMLSCNNNKTGDDADWADTSNTTDVALGTAGEITTAGIDSMCYLLVEGATKQDTKALKLVTDGDEVTGLLMYLPHEKDGRFGRFEGSRDGDIIFGTWYYEQEGIRDSVEVSFKKIGDVILQQAPSFNDKTGREYLNTSNPYSIRYSATDCRNLPHYNIDFSR